MFRSIMNKLILFFLVFISLKTSAQYPDPHFEHLSVLEGLPENFITALNQDKVGYIWAGTQNGLIRYDGYKLKVYKMGSNIKGASRNYAVYGINEARDGTLWAVTQTNHLFRYNRGTDIFEQYKFNNDFAQVNHNLYIQMTTDNDGNLWLFPNQNIVPDTIIPGPAVKINIKSHKQEQFPFETTSIINTLSGQVWLGTSRGIVNYNAKTGKIGQPFFPGSVSEKTFITELYEAPSHPGILWVKMVDSKQRPVALFLFDTRTHEFKKFVHNPLNPASIASDSVYCFHEDEKHRLWIGTSQGISLFNGHSDSFKNYAPPAGAVLPNNSVTQIAHQADGKLWLATYTGVKGNGIMLFDPSNGTFARYKHDEKKSYSLSSDRASIVKVDRANQLWVGMAWGGLDRVSRSRSEFVNYLAGTDPKAGYPEGGVTGIVRSSDGYCWMGANDRLLRWKPGAAIFTRITSLRYIDQRNIKVFFADREGLIWCRSENVRLFTINAKTFAVDTLKIRDGQVLKKNINSVYQASSGLIWLGTNGNGIYSYDKKSGKLTGYPYEIYPTNRYVGKKLDASQVRSIYEDKQGTLWVGTNLGGLNRFNAKDGTFTSFFNLDEGFNCVTQLLEDRAGRFWVGTYMQGLFLFDRKTGQKKQFTKENGLLDDDVRGLLEDQQGKLWVLCQSGITVFDPGSGATVCYTAKNALFAPPATLSLNAFIKTDDNQFIYGTPKSLVSFYPGRLSKNIYPPLVQIETLDHNDPQSNNDTVIAEGLYGRQKVELPHNQNRITLNFVALHFENPAQNQYAWQLVGYDKNWVMGGTQHAVTYTNLPPGTYTFNVKACNSDGIWTKKSTSIIVAIHPPWWQTWWARAAFMLFFSGVIWFVIDYRSRGLVRAKNLLEQKIQLRTKEVFEQKEEIAAQRDSIEQALGDLKSTQSQLIQSEKMASLGELTAGIAHEIQNPLNFVNNFSEVNAELIDEMQQEIENGDYEEVKIIAKDIKDNQQKISQHGKRADFIVKGMLQHSRTSTGERQLTNINILADEFFKLSYHGLRAKDKSFNAVLTTHFDDALPQINIVQQDIGRVLLNLFNNAFYAVNEKKKAFGDDYQPEVSVSTSVENDQLVISVKDNGVGIPDAVKEKIMQPFFTTKPAGQGTGLGLSLSYDIVVKGHDGKIEIDTRADEFTEFTITLPI